MANVELLVKDAKRVMPLLLWMLFFFWAALWIMSPTAAGDRLIEVVGAKFTGSSFFPDYGAVNILYATPVVVLAILALLYLQLKNSFPDHRQRCARSRRQPAGATSTAPWTKRLGHFLWTQPLTVKGPLGITTGIDIMAVAGILAAVLWIFLWNLVPEILRIADDAAAPPIPRPADQLHKYLQLRRIMATTAVALARAATLPLALLFFPVARGSPILRLIDLPFAHAVKYHRWLGHLALALVATHAALFVAVFVAAGAGASQLTTWPRTGISPLSGIIAIAAGLTMWVTSSPPIRRRWFDVFFITHQLYLVFFAFFTFHVGPAVAGPTVGGVFLYFVDRFIRFVQSRHSLSLLSAKVYPSGVMELKLRKSPGVMYSALSAVFVNVPCVSRLQWHPFSVTSSPCDDNPTTLSICVKPLGGWTRRLHAALLAGAARARADSGTACPFSKQLFVEGPYGHDSDYFLRYDALILVAGGIGVTPFIAILRDLFHRCRAREAGLPHSVELIWSVRRGSELALLTDLFPPDAGLAGGAPSVRVTVTAFMTGPDDRYDLGEVSLLHGTGGAPRDTVALEFPNVSGAEGAMTPVAAAGHGGWAAGVVAAAAGGALLASAAFTKVISHPHDRSQRTDVWLYFASTAIGVVGFGGAALVAWSTCHNMTFRGGNNPNTANRFASDGEEPGGGARPSTDLESATWQGTLLDRTHVMRGRPNIPELFDAAAEAYGDAGAHVGVLVCAPEGLRQRVAAECRTRRRAFHFHSVSFNL